MARSLTLVVADGTRAMGELDVYESFEITGRFNAVSTWQLAAPSSSPLMADWLACTAPRLMVRIDGAPWRSGPVTHIERVVEYDGDHTTVSGVDDLVYLTRRVAHPTPATAAPPYSSQAYDVRTGSASQVIAQYVNANAGPGAVAARRVEGLTVPVPAALGGTITGSARYEQLLDFVVGLAGPLDLGVEVVDLALRVFQPAGSAVFSTDLGTLASWRAQAVAPEANFAYVAGGGVGAARLIVEASDAASIAGWGRVETFVDRRDTTDLALLAQAGAKALEEGVDAPTVALEVLDVPGQQWLTDWNLGDVATVVLPGTTLVDVIREVTLTAEGNTPLHIRPVLGGGEVELAVFRRLNEQSRRVRQLERI